MRIQPSVYVALGSNMGDSVRIVQDAMERLQTLSERPIIRSSLWRTSPVDCPEGSPSFINAAIGLWPHPMEQPDTMLIQLQGIEKAFGRERKGIINDSRPLDLDLICFGDKMESSALLILPHPRAVSRSFVLAPLAEIAPDLVLPGQKESTKELLAALDPLDKPPYIEKIGLV